MKSRILIVLALFVALTAWGRKSGKCGESATWEFENGVMTISGTGAMYELDRRAYGVVWAKGIGINEITTLKVGEGITSVTGFYDCTNLTSVSLPSTLKRVDYRAFYRCLKLTSITIPQGVISIRSNAFYGSGLKSIVLPEGVDSIGYCAFENCQDLRSISLPSTLIFIGHSAFENCKSLESLNIPNSVKTLGQDMFMGDEKLTAIVFPDDKPAIDLSSYRGPGMEYLNTLGLRYTPSVTSVRGNNGPCPKYVIENITNDYVSSLYAVGIHYSEAIESMYRNSPWVRRVENSFSYYAYDKIKERLALWQQKKNYESAAQYQARVTEANRQQQVGKIIAELQDEYVSERLKKAQMGDWQLGTYDSDYGAYVLTFMGASTTAVVPVADRVRFEQNFKENKVTIQPSYGVVDDQLAILECDFKLGNKTYHSAQTYQNDNGSALAANLPPLQINLGQSQSGGQGQGGGVATTPIDNSIDTNIPVSGLKSDNTFAVIIGNENYQRVAKVEYAANDANTFAAYCRSTLGIPQKNVRTYHDATYGTMLAALKDIQAIAKAYKGNLDVIFYYAGHGVPSETSQSAFLLPVDADGSQTEVCLSTKRLYQTLNDLHARKVVVLMDACFSGAQRGDGMLASARGVALKVKDDVPTGNMVVFTAANGDQTAYPYREKGHGLFTYYLLKKLQDTKGNTTLGALTDYVSDEVARQSVVENKHSQTPTVIPATALSSAWRDMKLQ